MTHSTGPTLLESHGIEPSDRFARSMLPLSILALDGTQLFVNDATCRLVSRPGPVLTGTPATDLCRSEADREIVEAVLAAARGGDPGGSVTYDVLVPPERVITVQLTWTLMTAADGEPWYLTAAYNDETARVEAVHAAERGAATLRARFDQSSLPQATLDLDGRFSAVNPAFCALLGRSSDELAHRDIRTLTQPGAAGSAGEGELSAVLSGTEAWARFEHVVIGAGGTPIPVHVELTVMRDESGQPFGAAVFLHDLTSVREQDRQRQQQAAYFVALSQLSGDLAIVGDIDGKLLYVSPAVERVLGYTQDQLTGACGWDFVHPDDLACADEAYNGVVAEGGSRTHRMRLRTADGTWRWMEQTSTNRLRDAIGGVVCNLRDITAQVQADLALRESEERFRAIAETANEGIWALAPDGETLYANARMAAILGMTLPQVYVGRGPSRLDSADAADVAKRLSSRTARGPEHYEIGFQHPSGERRRLGIAASPLPGPDGSTIGSLAMVSDVTEARHIEQELRRASLHDALTGLPNRALFLDRLEHALARDVGRTAVIFLDLDHFKQVNDSRGHDIGDEVLVTVGRRLAGAVRAHDTVGRFGGDEFVVLAEDVDEAVAQQLAQQLLAALAEPVTVAGVAFHVAASAGVALSPPAVAGDLLRYADTAMYEAKAAGRDRLRFFDPALAEEAEKRYVLGGRLRLALAEDALTMHYQPIIDLRSGQVLGMEALARWTDPELGAVPPDRFVGIAELAGLAPALDRWAIERALREARALRRAGAVPLDAYVSVNLSASNVSDRGLEDFIVTTTTSSGLAPADVVLEITEGAVMRDADLAISLLRRLRVRGFRLAIDDFGSGHSSLAYLRDLPISILKIDRSFVAGIREDSDALAVVAAIVDLGRAVGMTVVAEGVEDAEQALLLRELGCQAAQGWLWSTAVTPPDIRAHGAWARGYDVGPDSRPTGPRRRPARAQVKAEHGLDRLLGMHRKGASLATIAAALNRDGYLTPNGLRWHKTSVARAVSDAAYPDLVQELPAPSLRLQDVGRTRDVPPGHY